jgi:hypothetical protein
MFYPIHLRKRNSISGIIDRIIERELLDQARPAQPSQASSCGRIIRELQKAASAVVRSDHGIFVPIFRTLAHVDWNCPFPPGVNGDKLTGWHQKHYTGTTPFHTDGTTLPDIAPGTIPLVVALRYHRDTVLRTLLQEPTLDKSWRGEYGQTCLWELSRASRNLYHLMDQLAVIELNAQDMYGNIAVTFVVISKQRDILTMLVKRGRISILRMKEVRLRGRLHIK